MSILVLLFVIATVLAFGGFTLWRTQPTTKQGVMLKWAGLVIIILASSALFCWVAWMVYMILVVVPENY